MTAKPVRSTRRQKRSPSSQAHASAASATTVAAAVDAVAAALRYVSDHQPGIRRRRSGKGFVYLNSKGRGIHDLATLQRIRQLVIPPAWTNVWISPLPNGHLQATGRDAKGRKQYRYHDHWRQVRDDAKFDRLIEFGAALPKLRRRVQRDLRLRGICREKVLASIVSLLESTSIRIGNDEYARVNGSFGLTTLRNHHVQVNGQSIHFHFRGKSGKVHTIDVSDPRIACIMKQCQDLPGHELFEYLDDAGNPHEVNSEDVNQYLREVTGQDFTAKDFRTWNGTLLTIEIFRHCQRDASRPSATKKIINTAVRQVAEQLGNTIAVCRKCYIHPAVIEAFQSNSLTRLLKSRQRNNPAIGRGLRSTEKILLRLLSRSSPDAGKKAA
jgi:DNA topoisomerase I